MYDFRTADGKLVNMYICTFTSTYMYTHIRIKNIHIFTRTNMYDFRTADGMLVTGQNPQSSEETAKNLLKILAWIVFEVYFETLYNAQQYTAASCITACCSVLQHRYTCLSTNDKTTKNLLRKDPRVNCFRRDSATLGCTLQHAVPCCNINWSFLEYMWKRPSTSSRSSRLKFWFEFASKKVSSRPLFECVGTTWITVLHPKVEKSDSGETPTVSCLCQKPTGVSTF